MQIRSSTELNASAVPLVSHKSSQHPRVALGHVATPEMREVWHSVWNQPRRTGRDISVSNLHHPELDRVGFSLRPYRCRKMWI